MDPDDKRRPVAGDPTSPTSSIRHHLREIIDEAGADDLAILARYGMRVEGDARSPFVQMMLDELGDAAAEAMRELILVDPTDAEQVRKYQFAALTHYKIRGFLLKATDDLDATNEKLKQLSDSEAS